ncbi:DNA repair protein [Pedobacter sp. HMF7647]|uniref:DNA repair protein n=1 Tax=Hufsiella arboris TaxID=2695275 RepID=A0A7K1Y6T9_9SPHI|nr:JAB domain-containing protein [Hufsiella arboris]MXV50292.1 DNA repair protein [Hufsiella arboris]
MENLSKISTVMEVAEISVSYCPKVKASNRPKVTCSADAYKVFYGMWDQDRLELVEHFYVMLLNRCNRVLGVSLISSGGFSGTIADPKLIFAIALKAGASAMILAHNHPSGNLAPSSQDRALTAKLQHAGSFLDIAVNDHLIICPEGCYYSFADSGEM